MVNFFLYSTSLLSPRPDSDLLFARRVARRFRRTVPVSSGLAASRPILGRRRTVVCTFAFSGVLVIATHQGTAAGEGSPGTASPIVELGFFVADALGKPLAARLNRLIANDIVRGPRGGVLRFALPRIFKFHVPYSVSIIFKLVSLSCFHYLNHVQLRVASLAGKHGARASEFCPGIRPQR